METVISKPTKTMNRRSLVPGSEIKSKSTVFGRIVRLVIVIQLNVLDSIVIGNGIGLFIIDFENYFSLCRYVKLFGDSHKQHIDSNFIFDA